MQWWMNNTDHACDHIFIHHPEIGYTSIQVSQDGELWTLHNH